MLVAILAYGMPVGTTVAVATEGAAFGLFPIMWIVWNAIWIYNMTVETGHFAVLRRLVRHDLRRRSASRPCIIAFCFGALLEALAGFGMPVAITAVMLIAVGFKPMKAAAIALVANTAPVAFGAIAIPDRAPRRADRDPAGGPRRHGRPPDAAAWRCSCRYPRRDGRRARRPRWRPCRPGRRSWAASRSRRPVRASNYISVELTDIFGVAAVGGRDGAVPARLAAG